MKILIVYRNCSLQVTLALQLKHRGYAVSCIVPEELSDLFAGRFVEALLDDEDASDGILIDCASREFDADGRSALDDISFQSLITYCALHRWQYLLVSDSRVFPGGSKQRYREIDAVHPTAASGVLLASREQYIAVHWPHHIVLRTGPLITDEGSNLLTDFLTRLRGGGALSVSSAVRFCPTPAADVARVISAVCDQLSCNVHCWGVYHYHSSDPTTQYEFAEVLLAAAAQYWELDAARAQLQPTLDDPLGSLYPLLNCQRIRDTFGIQQLPWRKAIPQLLKTIYAGETS